MGLKTCEFHLLQGGNDHEIYESERTVGHTGKLSFQVEVTSSRLIIA